MSAAVSGLAWSSDFSESKRLSVSAGLIGPLFLIAAIAISLIELPERDRAEVERVPPQLAKLMKKKTPPPPPVVKKKEQEKKPEPKIEKKAEKKPEPKPVVKPKERPKTQPKLSKLAKPEAVKKAREKAKKSGLLAMNKQFEKLNSLATAVKVKNTRPVIAATTTAPVAADTLAKTVASTQYVAEVDTGNISQEVETLALATYGEELVEATVAEEETFEAIEAESREAAIARRSTEDVRRTMDANKSAIRSIYDRARRKKPSLQGVMTPELVITADGRVDSCKIVSSTLNDSKLESKICKRIRLFDFAAIEGVENLTIQYSIELLPG